MFIFYHIKKETENPKWVNKVINFCQVWQRLAHCISRMPWHTTEYLRAGSGWEAGTLCSGHWGWSLWSSRTSTLEGQVPARPRHVPGAVLRSLQKSSHLILTTTLKTRRSYCPALYVNKPRLRERGSASVQPDPGTPGLCFPAPLPPRFGAKMLNLGLKSPILSIYLNSNEGEIKLFVPPK